MRTIFTFSCDARPTHMSNLADFVPAKSLLDNTQITERSMGRYIAHVAVPCRDLDEAAKWYAEVIGAQPVRMLKDRVTFSVGGVLQLVCHLERRHVEANPRAYPRHIGLTMLDKTDFDRMRDHLLRLDVKFLIKPSLRFENSDHEHETFMIVDPSGNAVEFKCYVRPECSY
jgi:extradiol dioxygenase family protein